MWDQDLIMGCIFFGSLWLFFLIFRSKGKLAAFVLGVTSVFFIPELWLKIVNFVPLFIIIMYFLFSDQLKKKFPGIKKIMDDS